MTWTTALVLGFALSVLPAVTAADDREIPGNQVEFFEQKIRPVLVKHCLECHSESSGTPKGGLQLDDRDGVRKGGDSGPLASPGDPDASLLMQVLRYESYEMPPSGRRPNHVIDDFRRWVEMGLPDPRESTGPAAESDHAPVPAVNLWSLQLVEAVETPQVPDDSWSRQPVDHFILSRLKQAGIHPVADAEPARLLRRLHFILTGLPPTAADIDRFCQACEEDRTAAVTAEVDRLLASVHFGERWGRHWLDVARYAESNGMAWNMSFPYAWRYRDYVIASFNKDKPFNRFITEQLAGDLLPADTQEERQEQLIATAFLAFGSKPLYEKEEEIEQNRLDWVDERINVIGKGLLGLTVGCARCHDHKFDPVPTRDYYAMAGILLGTEILSGPKVGRPAVWRQERLYDESVLALSSPNSVAAARKAQTRLREIDDALKRLQKKKAANQAEITELEAERAQLRRQTPQLEYTHGVREAPSFEPACVRIRGEWDRYGEEVPRGFLTAIDISEADFKPYEIGDHESGRRQLARWITHPRNPLTARVIVNRVWHHVFGKGIVATVDNFGMNGARPAHPKLLDSLAHRFVHTHHWSVKSLVRELVLSHTFALASHHDESAYRIDPDNQLLWRSRPRRLEAEAIRDAILATGGLLNLEPLNGSSVAKLRYTLLSPADVEKIHSSEQARRRSIYLAVLRGQETDDLLAVFDFPDPGMVKGRREITTVPSQSLLMMNSPLLREAAESIASDLLRNDFTDTDRIAHAFRLILNRAPTSREFRQSHSSLERFEGTPDVKWTAFTQSLLLSTEFRYLY